MQEAKEWVEKARDQYGRGRYAESIISAEWATSLDEDETMGWWFSALSHQAVGNLYGALESLDRVTDQSPEFADGWARYGAVLQALNADDDEQCDYHMSAQDAFEEAIEHDENNAIALASLAKLYSDNKSDDPEEIDKEIKILARLEESEGYLTSGQLNRFGILHYNNKNYFHAIKYWSRATKGATDPASLFNLGLVYNHTEVSQDADAVDLWRLTAQRYPSYEKADEKLKQLLPRLLTLSQDAMLSGTTVLRSGQWYQNYLNPFELLDFQDQVEDPLNVDVKKLQKLRKRLIQEIELEDGLVPWMEGMILDRSAAINACEELNNDDKLAFHLHVFNNKPLLGFLSRGEHQHFIVDANWSPIETLEYLDRGDDRFRAWLSDPFINQFELVIGKAIDEENLAVIEVLLDGRRWVTAPNSDHFFESARKKINRKLEKLEDLKIRSEQQEVSITMVNRVLNEGALLDMLNLFPTFFWEQQSRALDLVRSIAVSNYNEHGDSALSISVLELTKKFLFKSVKHNDQVKKDFKAIKEIIKQENDVIEEANNRELSMTKPGGLITKMLFSKVWKISKNGVQKGDLLIPMDSIVSVRWGALISGTYESPVHVFSFVFKDKSGQNIEFKWKARREFQQHHQYSDDIIHAINHFVLPGIIERQVANLERGRTIQVGKCSVSKNGVGFKPIGSIFFKNHFVPWDTVKIDMGNIDLTVIDSWEPSKWVNLPLRSVDNAVTLKILKELMK